MYDTVKVWQSSDCFDRGYLEKIPTLLTNVSFHQKQDGHDYLTGNLENLYISISVAGFSINGSLNKYWYKDNFNKLTRQEVQHCTELLEDTLHLNLKNAEVKKFDIAHNFMMEAPVQNYYSLLGDSQRYNRLCQEKSVYYSNNLRTKLFYDKVDEGKRKGFQIPPIWLNRNVLRYELRFKGRLNTQFKTNQILMKDLYDEQFYMRSIDWWIKEYSIIKKNRLLTPNISNMTTKNAKDYLLSALIELVGQNEVTTLTDTWKGNFSTPKEAQRFKKSLNSMKNLTEESPLIEELDKKILRVKEYYR